MNRQTRQERQTRVFWVQNQKKTLAALAVLAVQLLGASPASADPYGDPPMKREGFAAGIAIGPGIFKGAGGMDDLQGVGGDLNLRIGTTAGGNLLWLMEVVAGGYLVEVTSAEVAGGVDQTYNALSTLTFGAQIYLREALWLRGGAGFATFLEREGRSGVVEEDSRRAGVGFIGGGGYDFFRRGRFAVSIELASTVGAFRSGPLGQASVLLGLAWY